MGRGGRTAGMAAALWLIASSATAADEAARLDALFEAWRGPDAPGCAVTATRDGQVLATRAYGNAIVEAGKANTPRTAFHVASVSKGFTAYAIGLLEAEGRLSLDDDVRRYVPEMHDFGRPITLANLLHHTSGLRDQWELLTLQGRRHGDAFTQADVLRALFDQRELNFQPGERHAYSNSNYTLLALVVERVAGKPFADVMAERVFGPLGMDDSYVNAEVRTIRPDQAWPYATGPNGFERRQLAYSNYGATDVRTTARDMAHWLIALEGAGEGGPLAAMGEPARDAQGREVAYARGLIRGVHRGESTLEHGGIDPGYAAYLMTLPGRRLGVAVMCNVETDRARDLARATADLFLGVDDAQDAAPVASPLETPPETAPDASVWPSLAGLYKDEDGLPFAIEFRDGVLLAQGQDRMRSLGGGRFDIAGRPATFVFAADGGLTIDEAGVERHARKVEHRPPPRLEGDALGVYAGEYYSPELGVTARVELRDGELRLRAPGLEAPLFQPPDMLREADVFFSPSPLAWLTFRRDAEGRVSEMASTNGRVANLRFLRIRPPSL